VAGSDCAANCDRVVLFADDFNSPAVGQLQKSSPLPAYYELGYDAGEYFVRKIAPTWPQSPGVAIPGRYTDTSVQVDARLVGPTEQRYLVVVCRDQGTSDSNYRLMIDPSRGAVSLNRWDAGRQVQLTDWQVSPAVRTGNEVNHLELICNGSQIAALINGIQVAAVTDATYSQGQILLLVGHAASTPSTVEGRFDNLLVTRP
jgi:hypothetical protein